MLNANQQQENAASLLTTSCPLTDKHLQPCPILQDFPPLRREKKENLFLVSKASAFTLCHESPVLSHLSRDVSVVFVQELLTDSRLLNRMKFIYYPSTKSFQNLAPPISSASSWRTHGAPIAQTLLPPCRHQVALDLQVSMHSFT